MWGWPFITSHVSISCSSSNNRRCGGSRSTREVTDVFPVSEALPISEAKQFIRHQTQPISYVKCPLFHKQILLLAPDSRYICQDGFVNRNESITLSQIVTIWHRKWSLYQIQNSPYIKTCHMRKEMVTVLDKQLPTWEWNSNRTWNITHQC